jgi:hypothetical protein
MNEASTRIERNHRESDLDIVPLEARVLSYSASSEWQCLQVLHESGHVIFQPYIQDIYVALLTPSSIPSRDVAIRYGLAAITCSTATPVPLG